MALPAGVRVGPYEIVAPLGSGGMGVVYKARDTRLNRFIALKTLSEDTIGDADMRRRFLREAQAASQLNHPNIITIHESLEENGTYFLVMEYVVGSTLESVLATQTLSISDAMHYAAQIADGLAAAHHAGIIHRDLKPANIMITGDGRIKLLDFGLARFIEHAVPSDITATTQTLQGTVLGTASYMSPEQAQGRTLDVRSDIFSFGCVLYEMFSGHRAFKRESWVATLAAVLESEPAPLRELRSTVPPSLVQPRHITRCLRKDPKERFQTVLEAKQALAGMSLNGTRKSRRSLPSPCCHSQTSAPTKRTSTSAMVWPRKC